MIFFITLTVLAFSQNVYSQESIYKKLGNVMVSDQMLQKDDASFSQHQQLRVASLLLDRAAPTPPGNQLSLQTILDLSICPTQRSGKTSLVTTCAPKSIVGALSVGALLTHPLSDTQALKKRSAFIQELVENEELFSQLSSLVSEYAKIEKNLLSFWHTSNTLFSPENINEFFGGNLQKKHSAFKLEAKMRFNDLFEYGAPVFGGIINALIFLVGIHTNPQISDAQKAAALKKAPLPGLAAMALYAFLIKNKLVTHYEKTVPLILKIRKHFLPFQIIGSLAQKISDLTQQNDNHIEEHIPSVQSLKNARSLSLATQRFFNNLNHRSQKSKSYFFSRLGPTLMNMPLFIGARKDLEKMFAPLGMLDAYLSLAQLYKKHQGSEHSYSMAHFSSDQKPLLEVHGGWHPFLGQKAVPLSFQLGRGAHNNVVVTGPNAAGKSTFIKTMLVNAIFAQTCGFAPAQSCTLTPFSYIGTSLNLVDDITDSKSLFRAEIERARIILEKVKQTNERGKHSLVALDEVFCGTAPRIGAATAYALSDVLGSYTHNTTLIASHFSQITGLVKAYPDRFSAYRFVAHQNSDGSFRYPYTIEPGISSQKIALSLLEAHSFSPQMISYAKTYLDQLR